MKKIKFLALAALVFLKIQTYGQNINSDQIIGTWLIESKDAKIEIFKKDNEYCGKLVWSNTMYEADGKTSKKDVNNTEASLRTRNIKDLLILRDFKYEDGAYKDGKIYDIKGGKTYSCIIKLRGTDTMLVKGYIGISLLGKTVSFMRVK